MFYFFIGLTLFIVHAFFFQFNLVVLNSCKTNAVLLTEKVSY